MNRLKLIDELSSRTEEDVFVEIDGVAYDITGFGHMEAEFDGFDEFYPEAVSINIKKE